MKHHASSVALLMALALATGARAQQPFPAGPINPPPPPPPPTPPPSARDSTGLTPLSELGTAKYKGEDGGLYGGGKNEPPAAHRSAWVKACAQVQPLDAEGRPAKDGKVVLLTVGFSNTHLESDDFKRLSQDDPEI